MNNCKTPIVIGMLGMFLIGMNTLAQTKDTLPTLQAPVGRIVVPDNREAVDSFNTALTRPVLPERNALPPEVQKRIDQFQLDARRYLQEHEALRRKLMGANDAERARIQRDLDKLRRDWLERARELRQQFRERQRVLIDKLPAHRELFENARQAAQDQIREQQRERRGDR
jgi:hypothetical protein